jgi:hypothetical protein
MYRIGGLSASSCTIVKREKLAQIIRYIAIAILRKEYSGFKAPILHLILKPPMVEDGIIK